MCNETKAKITSVLRAQMLEFPFQKITVQDLMTRANMKRQSFYYHFQDIYQVLEWEVERSLFDCLPTNSATDCEGWLRDLLHILEADRAFYRKVILAVGRSKAMQKIYPHILPHVTAMMHSTGAVSGAAATEDDQIAIEFIAYALCNYLLDNILGHKPLDTEENIRRLLISCRMSLCTRIAQ